MRFWRRDPRPAVAVVRSTTFREPKCRSRVGKLVRGDFMEQFAFAFVLMVVSAALSIAIGERTRASKTSVYVLGLVTLLAQIVVLFALRA